MIHFKKSFTAAFSIFLTIGIFTAAYAEEIYLPMNGDYLSPVRNQQYVHNTTQYKAVLEDYIEGDKFKTSQPHERENSVKKLLNEEIGDIGIRILSSSEEESSWSVVDNKLEGLRVLADVLRDSGYPELENLVTSGLLEAQDLYIFEDEGNSLCGEHPEERCPAFKTMYLVDLIEKIPNEEMKNRLMEIIETFSSFQAIPSNPADA